MAGAQARTMPSGWKQWREVALNVGAWVLAAMVSLFLALQRYRGALATSSNYDLDTYFLPAARAVAAGESPYVVHGYVYSPFVAVLLAPIASKPWAPEAWTLAMIVAGVLGCLAVSLASTKRRPPWVGAVVFVVATTTLLATWPFTWQMFLGQSDMLVLLSLGIAMYAMVARRPVLSGFGLAMAGVVKTWPAGLLLWLLRAPLRRRVREWMGVAGGAAIAVVLALATKGGLIAMVRAAFEARNQGNITVFSAVGAGRMLFDRNGVVSPIAVVPAARLGLTIGLTAIVLVLLAVALRRPGDPLICLSNLVFCVILLSPVSHYSYLLLPLPTLWCWFARLLSSRRDKWAYLAVAILGLWWLVALRRIPAGEVETSLTWPDYLLILGSTLVAATASVVLAAGLPREELATEVAIETP